MLLKARTLEFPEKGTVVKAVMVGGEAKYLRPPFRPFFYSEYYWNNGKPVMKKRLSDLIEREYYKVSFDSDNSRHYNSHAEGVMEGRVSHLRRLAALIGFKLPQALPPKLLSWDLESITNGIQPNPETDILRSVAAYREDGTHEFKTSNVERKVAEWYVGLIQDEDPDVILDYNGSFYDMPLMQNACRRSGIKFAIGRDGSEPQIHTWEYKRGRRLYRKARVYIGGRVHFDVYKEVEGDQGLYDLKDRRLHTVSKHFGLYPIEGIDHAAIPEERLEEVNVDDARITMGVAKVYLPVLYELSERLEVPFNMMVERSPSFIAELIYMQEFDKLGIISDGTNADRFPWAFGGKGKAYEGAEVRCFHRGLFKPIGHSDFGSFYPNIMAAGNFSPETCQLAKLKPYTGKYVFKRMRNFAFYEVPDKYRGQVVVRVDISKDSVTKRRVKELLDLRAVEKRRFKESNDPDAWSRSWALKIMANAIYGYHGMRYSLYGNVLVAILTTAMARYIIRQSLTEHRKKGYRIIEVDTDGFWWYLENMA